MRAFDPCGHMPCLRARQRHPCHALREMRQSIPATTGSAAVEQIGRARHRGEQVGLRRCFMRRRFHFAQKPNRFASNHSRTAQAHITCETSRFSAYSMARSVNYPANRIWIALTRKSRGQSFSRESGKWWKPDVGSFRKSPPSNSAEKHLRTLGTIFLCGDEQ